MYYLKNWLPNFLNWVDQIIKVKKSAFKFVLILNKKNIWVRRPGTGDYSAEEYYSLLGKKIKKNIKKNTQIKKIHFS